MKKRLIFISLTLVMVLMVLAPSAALASHGKGNQNGNHESNKGNFDGSGWICVTAMPDPLVEPPIWRFQDEIVEGVLDQCDWDLLAGTVFWSEHDSVVWVDEQGNANGVMRGTFSLTRYGGPDDSGKLSGTFTGRISGNLYTGEIYDEGSWRGTSGEGCFENVQARGEWAADLHYELVGTDITLVGTLDWSGSYTYKHGAGHDVPGISDGFKDKAREAIESHVKENIRDKIRKYWNQD